VRPLSPSCPTAEPASGAGCQDARTPATSRKGFLERAIWRSKTQMFKVDDVV
jgi:hypothetical protein